MSALHEHVVLTLCRHVDKQLRLVSPNGVREKVARRELVGCLLASQVRHSSAVAWTSAFDQAGLLANEFWRARDDLGFGERVRRLLAGKHPASKKIGRYRFFRVRAQQLTNARNVLANRPLRSFIRADNDMRETRRLLVRDIAGLGPKQASMFLRNIGVTNELAVLDRYVLRFMTMAGLTSQSLHSVSRMAQYESLETTFASYARDHGFSPGSMDWAVWATMKAAAELDA